MALAAVVVAFLLGFGMSLGQAYLDYKEEVGLLEQKITKSLQVAEKAASRAVLILDSDLAQEVVSGLLEYDYVVAARILDDQGAVLAEAEQESRRAGGSMPLLHSFFEETDLYNFPLQLPEMMADQPGMLNVTVDRARGLEPFFSRAVTNLVSGFARNLILALLLYMVFYRGVTRSLTSVVDNISRINPEQPGEQRIDVPARHEKDELGLLARQINGAFDAVQELLDNLRATNQALSTSEEALRRRSDELEREVERTKQTSEELMRTKEEAEAANRAKSVFLANVSHELRTPLNAIIGFSSIMDDAMFGPLGNEKYQHYANDIRSSSQHLSEILGEVLDLAKIEAGQVEIEDEDVDVVRLIREAVALVDAQATKKNLRIRQHIDTDLPHLRCDRLRVKQSLLNLVSNAVKFTPDGKGDIEIAAYVDEGGGMAISVTDSGIGIPEEEQELIFSPFMRSASAHSRSHEGTGLGLSLVKAFTVKHDGDVTLKSKPGRGSCFTMHFPADRVLNGASDGGEKHA
ncbi:sensor histidine kinase [Yunchengibacter salinarum]|uniref:sensor histidine kinase n=1 Tax=Yunchengibacter salinarum TaxID=3133399 RepID=UPI0035B61A14